MKGRFPLLAAIVLAPLLILAGLAWRGVESQRQAAWTEKREEAERICAVLAPTIVGGLGPRSLKIRIYPDPPIPQASDEGTKRLDEADTLTQLKTISYDAREQSLTTGGIPIRVLAAAKVLEKENSTENAVSLMALAIHLKPSVLTGPILTAAEKRGVKFPGSWRDEWQEFTQARDIVLSHPKSDKVWVKEPEGWWWIDREPADPERPTEVISPRLLDSLLESLSSHRPSGSNSMRIPAWAKLRFKIAAEENPPGEALARRAIAEYPGLSLEITAADPALIETGVRSQQHWALAIVGTSLLAATIGLVLIHRTLARERRLNELKSHFVASVSHELRAPVGSIRLMADALDEGKVSRETAADFHRLISREGKRLSNLIENVLDFARIEQGRKHWHFEATDLIALVADTVKVMEPLAAEKGIALGFIHEVSGAEPVLDSGAIQQALVNLLDNAIKFSPPDSGVEVLLSSDDRHWRLAVRDHGPGIPPAEQKKIFERFYRPGNELRRETQGTGIGLSLVKAIAEAHGGRVELDSRAGIGSTFTLVIPIHATSGH